MEDTIQTLLEMLKVERAETVRLTNILLERLGVELGTERVVHVDSGRNEVSSRRATWPARKAELEKFYRKAAESAAEELIDAKNENETVRTD